MDNEYINERFVCYEKIGDDLYHVKFIFDLDDDYSAIIYKPTFKETCIDLLEKKFQKSIERKRNISSSKESNTV